MIQQLCTNYARAAKMLFPMLLSALLLFSFGSCTDEQINNPNPNGEEKQITLSLTTPKSFIAATYADPAAVDENKIQTIDVLVFDDAGNYFSGPHFGSLTSSGSTSDVKINIPNSVVAGYKLAIFANSRKAINAVASTFTDGDDKETTLKKIVLDDTAIPSLWETADSKNLIPMHAEVDFANITSTVSLVRMVARIDVTVTDETLADFDLKTVHLYKHNTVGYVAPIAVTGTPSIPTGDDVKATSALLYSTASNEVKNQIYTFEAAAGDGTDFSENTCLVIGGRYNGDADDSYYRVDFYGKKQGESNNAYLALLRNHMYTVSVSKVYGPGYDDPDKAAASKPINVTYNIDAWDTSTIVDGGYNGQYFLGVSAAEFNFDAAARNNTTGDNILIIKTNHPDGWSWSGGDDWLSLTEMNGTAINSSTPVVSTSSTVRLSLTANTEGGASLRSGVIKLTAGNVTYDISVTQDKTLNSDNLFPSEAPEYYLRPNGNKIFIPVSRANAGNTINLNQGDVFTVGWEAKGSGEATTIKAVKPVGTGSNGHVYVEAGTTGGEVEVFIKKGNDELCRWTVFVSEPESNSYIVTPNTTILIPVSQINNFKRDLIKLTDNSNNPIATDADAANAWFDDNAAFTTGWIWKENSNLTVAPVVVGKGIDGFIKVAVSGSTTGNAVVAAIQNNLIRWSWHLWVVASDDLPSVFPGSPFMDRNLGALNKTVADPGSKGLHYQWGRKDPFPTSNIWENGSETNAQAIYNTPGNLDGLSAPLPTTIGKVNVSNIASSTFNGFTRLNGAINNVDYAVANPHTFYFMSAGITDWYVSSGTDEEAGWVTQNNNLWGGYSTPLNYKTAFDPCPPGWTLPQSNTLNTSLGYGDSGFKWTNTSGEVLGTSPWVGLTSANIGAFGNGYTWDGTTESETTKPNLGGYYPAAGRRYFASGSFTSVGTDGVYWSASPRAINNRLAGNLYLSGSGSVSPAGGDIRSGGYSVRCVQE